ncbi:MAG: hypothetical protein F6K40_18725 [Okeania sp. SIO3I5]|uniref:hypothetical protein n=1 Tax=Okeania sp. SIO3I5 TaxID=2607805 RepID=UPI0013B982AE|nr:hypothetical protein [Okeania sp. SIO3I5]NEQ38184.1 hypothetical protein [Okeania sp. SIO3I5]
MKTKHLLMAGLGLISFVGMSLSSVQKAFGQERVVEDNQGRLYLEVRQGYNRPDTFCAIRRDYRYCFNVSYNPSECYQGVCFFSLIRNVDQEIKDRNRCLLARRGNIAAVHLVRALGLDCTTY